MDAGRQIGTNAFTTIYASKDRFSRELLAERIEAGTATMPTGDALATWAKDLDRPVEELTKVSTADSAAFVEKIPQGEAFDWLVKMTGEKASGLTQTLYEAHNIGMVWYIMGVVGVITAIAIWVYGKWILTLKTEMIFRHFNGGRNAAIRFRIGKRIPIAVDWTNALQRDAIPAIE